MKKISRLFLLPALILLLSGCSEQWDDLVDSVSGSGDDAPAPIKEVAVVEPEVQTEPEPVVQTEPEPEVEVEPEVSKYETEFHHTSTGSSDGGKSLVLCPGQNIMFDSCSVGSVSIPYHGKDDGRLSYWNMREEPRGDIVCEKDGKTYRFKADSMQVYGSCR